MMLYLIKKKNRFLLTIQSLNTRLSKSVVRQELIFMTLAHPGEARMWRGSQ